MNLQRTRLRGASASALLLTVAAILFVGLFSAGAARADVTSTQEAWGDIQGPYDFEPGFFSAGDIQGQQGWSTSSPSDESVEQTSSFPGAANYGFGEQALRLSDADGFDTMAGVVSPPTQVGAGEDPASQSGLEYTFDIGTTGADEQPGLQMSVSAIDSNYLRMTYLRFADEADGIHVYADEADNPGPAGNTTDFTDTDIGTLSHGQAHQVKVMVEFEPGGESAPEGNDAVDVYLDGALVYTGHTWENYYRYDPEQAVNGNQVPSVDRLWFRTGGPFAQAPGTKGQGFLVDDVFMNTGPIKPVSNVDPYIIGAPDTGLGCEFGRFSGVGISYSLDWLRDGQPISGAGDDPVYDVRPEDAGHSLACRLTATSAFGTVTSVTSQGYPIPPAPSAPITTPTQPTQPATPTPPASTVAPPAPEPSSAPYSVIVPKAPAPVAETVGAPAEVAVVVCGTDSCAVTTPKATRVKVAGHWYRATVVTSTPTDEPDATHVGVKLAPRAAKALQARAGRRGFIRMRVHVTVDGVTHTEVVKAKVRGPRHER